MPEYGLQLFQFQGRGHPEHAFAVKTAVRDQDVAVGIEAEEVAEGLDGDDGAGNRIPFWYGLLQEDLQRVPGASAQLMEKPAIVEKIPAQDLRDAEDEMPMRNLFQHLRA